MWVLHSFRRSKIKPEPYLHFRAVCLASHPRRGKKDKVILNQMRHWSSYSFLLNGRPILVVLYVGARAYGGTTAEKEEKEEGKKKDCVSPTQSETRVRFPQGPKKRARGEARRSRLQSSSLAAVGRDRHEEPRRRRDASARDFEGLIFA